MEIKNSGMVLLYGMKVPYQIKKPQEHSVDGTFRLDGNTTILSFLIFSRNHQISNEIRLSNNPFSPDIT